MQMIPLKVITLFQIVESLSCDLNNTHFQVAAQMQHFLRVPSRSLMSAPATCQTGTMQKLDWSSTGSTGVSETIQDCSGVQIGPNDGLTEKCNRWHLVIWSCARVCNRCCCKRWYGSSASRLPFTCTKCLASFVRWLHFWDLLDFIAADEKIIVVHNNKMPRKNRWIIHQL